MLLTFAIFSASGILLQAVIAEKENRTIEVILSSLTPWQFLTGKVLGLGLLGLVQLGIWMALARLGVNTGMSFLATLDTASLPLSVWVLAVVYFLLGYLVYAALMAGIGAISPSMRDSSQLTIGVSFAAMIPLMLLRNLAADPQGGLATFLSLFPPTAPISMMIRLAVSDVPAWQVGLSLALLALMVAGTIWAAARLFRATTLLNGQKLAWREFRRALAG
jgi:ABC-2 type transport system permease protein